MILTKSGNYIRFKEVMKMTKIKLTQEAYIEGYEGAFLRYGNSVHGIWDNWYTAHAEDGEGNSYNVYWKIKGDYDPEIMEEEYACDWDSPYMVVDEYGNTRIRACSFL